MSERSHLWAGQPRSLVGGFKPANRSPDVKGLYLGGGAAHPGPGMPMVLMSGWIAADAFHQDIQQLADSAAPTTCGREARVHSLVPVPTPGPQLARSDRLQCPAIHFCPHVTPWLFWGFERYVVVTAATFQCRADRERSRFPTCRPSAGDLLCQPSRLVGSVDGGRPSRNLSPGHGLHADRPDALRPIPDVSSTRILRPADWQPWTARNNSSKSRGQTSRIPQRRPPWVTPGGRFSDTRRPVEFQPGLAHLASQLTRPHRAPLAIEYAFWEERAPEALVEFGEPFLTQSGAHSKHVWPALLEERLAQTQARLAEKAMSRDPSRFEIVLDGSAGVGGIYDAWRRLTAWSRLARFDPHHRRSAAGKGTHA